MNATSGAQPCGCLSWHEVVAAGVGAFTYRQLNYWTVNGLVRAHSHTQVHDEDRKRRTDAAARTEANRVPYVPGQGRHTGWERGEVDRVTWAANVMTCTSMLPASAFRLHDEGEIRIKMDGRECVLRAHPDPKVAVSS